jgi:hypothetical protein
MGCAVLCAGNRSATALLGVQLQDEDMPDFWASGRCEARAALRQFELGACTCIIGVLKGSVQDRDRCMPVHWYIDFVVCGDKHTQAF